MQDYEYKDEGGRFLCKLHHRLRCDECHYVSDLLDENKRYREVIKNVLKDFGMVERLKYGAQLEKALEESE